LKFLVSNQESTANIYGHTYQLRPFNSQFAGLQDILVADNGSASELLERHKDILSTASFDQNKVKRFPKPLESPNGIPAGSRIVVLRAGGIGDHIMLIPALAGLKEALSDSDIELWLAVQEDMFPIFEHQPFINRLLPLPLPMDALMEADFFVDFSEPIQRSDFNTQHPIDYYINFLGIKSSRVNRKAPRIYLNMSDKSRIVRLLNVIKKENNHRPLILIQWLASVRIRTFPPEKLTFLTHRFKEAVFVAAHHHTQALQSSSDIEKARLRVIDVSHHIRDLTDFMTAVSMIDGVISTDSAAYHVAASFDKPSIALFGSIPSNLRTCYYPKVRPIDADYSGHTCCSPCDRHKGICPEAQLFGTYYSPCLMSISESVMYEKFQKMMED